MNKKTLKKAWMEGRISPRKPVYTPEEKKIRAAISRRKRYLKNREEILESQRLWRERNPQRKKEISATYLKKNREKINSKSREKNKLPEQREYMRSYARRHRASNPDKYVSYTENRRIRKLMADGSHTDAEWLKRLAEFDGCCAYCGKKVKPMARDHDIPLARGGSNYINNILPACGPCNSSKGTLTAGEFRRRLAGEVVSLDPRWAKQLAEAQENGRKTRTLKRLMREMAAE